MTHGACVAVASGHLTSMLNLVSILLGLLTLFLGLPAFLPFLGWAYWLVLPISVVGAAVGALSRENGGRNLNLVLLAIFGARWALGGFVF